LLAVSHGENKRKKSDKSHHNKKQHNSKKSKEKASVSFDPAGKVAEYMSKFCHQNCSVFSFSKETRV
jgi:hypothetical protein